VNDWLIDKSALVRLGVSADAQEWAERIERGLVRITTVTRLEVGYSARSGTDARQAFGGAPLAAMPAEYLTPSIQDRALTVQLLLADHAERSIRDAVKHARERGYSWAFIGSLVGTSGEAARQRYGHKQDA
jgi:predicted nucleic acid-binding protein